MNAITLDPATYTCPEHQIDLTPEVREALEEKDTPLAYRRPLLGRAASRAHAFEVMVTCPGASGAGAHPLTCTGSYIS
ncbi:MAG TPA: hypothetical protein VGF54_10220 [Streptosporangiaceae bacterium]|jgi:hypothetical protein